AGALVGDLVAVHVLAGDHGVVGPGQLAVGAGDGEAALVGVVQDPALGGQLLDDRVDDMAHVADAVVVGAVVDEDPQRHTDLVGGEPDALGGALAGEHVVDQLGEVVVEGRHGLAGTVQHRVADHGDRVDLAPGAVGGLALL